MPEDDPPVPDKPGGGPPPEGRAAQGTPREYLSQFFAYEHLPPHLQAVSKPFGELSQKIIAELPSNPERTTALRKLLESKDCAVRALLFK